MKRLVGITVGLAVVVLILLAPAAFWGVNLDDDAGPEPTTITSYDADFEVAKNGDLAVVEDITVSFPSSDRHGIFRFFDKSDQSSPNARRVPHDIEVTMDGDEVPFELLAEKGGTIVNAKIGDADSTVPAGEHVYRISYEIDGVLEESTTGTPTQFYWNLIPGGWLQSILAAKLTVHLPVPADGVQCAVGAGRDGGCTAEGDGSDTLVVNVADLDPNTPVTIKAGLDMETPPAGKTLPWTARFDPVFGQSVGLLGFVIFLALLAGLFATYLAKRAAERDPQFPILYAPPEGIGPAQAAYLVTEQVNDEQYVATLMYAEERGAITLERAGGAWTITDRQGAPGWAGLDPVTAGVAHLLGGPGTSFVASSTDVEAGKRLKAEMADFESSTKSWASGAGLMTKSGLGGLGPLLIVVALLAVPAIAIFNPFNMSFVGLIIGAFAICGVSLALPGSGTRRTKAGRDLWSRSGGFKRILSTPSAQDRFDFSGRQELYIAYIPWAVAFGCADEWAEKYRTEMATEPPAPSYFGGASAGAFAGSAVSSMVSDFNSTVSSAISAYDATQSSSSSSGGGGFSGGGGGGGGGGGSW